MRKIIFLLFIFFSVLKAQDLPTIDAKLEKELTDYLKLHFQLPENYILSKFQCHDIIFLGENHYQKQDPELVQKMIPLLYRKGIHYLGMEFARRIDQHLIDSLLILPRYDEKLARRIIFQQFVHWGFQEYVDIYKAAWKLNHSLPKGARKFRILGVNNSPDWSLIKDAKDSDNPQARMKVWHGEDEGDWAKVIHDSVIAKGEKALVYSGAHHAFSEYHQPIADKRKFIRFGDIRMGNFIFNEIGKRAITVYLHAPWYSARAAIGNFVFSADGAIDAVINKLEPKYQNAGFDLKGTPFGKLPAETSLYKFGYPEFKIEMMYDGYIIQGPMSSYKGVTPIKDFINSSNLEYARQHSPDPSFRNSSAEDFNKDIASTANSTPNLEKLSKEMNLIKSTMNEEAGEEKDLFDAENHLMKALQSRDSLSLENIFNKEFIRNGVVSKNDYIRNILHGLIIDSCAIRNPRVEMYGNTAKVDLFFYIKGRANNNPFAPFEYTLTDIWIKHDNRWQIITRFGN